MLRKKDSKRLSYADLVRKIRNKNLGTANSFKFQPHPTTQRFYLSMCYQGVKTDTIICMRGFEE